MPDELQYGERSQLQALGQKELGITGGIRPERPAGRPSGTMSNAGIPPATEAEYNVPPEEQEAMEDWFAAAKALRTATAYAQMPGAGAYSRLTLAAAQAAYQRASQHLKGGTPDWDF